MNRKIYISVGQLFMVLLLVTALISSCKDDEVKPDYTADKTTLKQLTDSIGNAYTLSVEGHDLGQYPKDARTTIKEAVDLANSVVSGNHTAEEVSNAYANLRRAIIVFNGRVIAEVAPESLIAKWLFNGSAVDATANHHDGALMSGIIGTSSSHTDGGTLPVLTTDRFGKSGNAYEFTNGAYIEVPYTESLNPALLSISLWINPKESYGDNYMVSLDRWHGFKFQLQSDNFLFMTLKTASATYDKDSNPGKMEVGKWHHGVVTVGNGAITFYVDGVLAKTESLAGTAAKVTAPINLVIGQQLPKDKFNFTDSSDPNYFGGAAFFKGSLDDIRYYNKILSADEVLKIYNNEKPD